jgi:hypothetical protein
LVIIVTLERTISVVYPHKLKEIFSKKKCKIIIICIVIVILIITSSAGFCCQYYRPKPYLCSLNDKDNCKYYFNNIYQIFKILLGSWLPSLFGFCLNTTFIIFLNRISSNRRKLFQMHTTTTTINKKETQISIMILAISISFLILTIPYSLFELMRKLVEPEIFNYFIPKHKVRYFQRATLLLIDLDHSTNFLFYVLSAERFRNQLKSIFWSNKNQQVIII